MKAQEKTKKKYKVKVTKTYWTKKISYNVVEGENVDDAMEQVEKDYEDDLLDWEPASTHHEGTDWGVEELIDDD